MIDNVVLQSIQSHLLEHVSPKIKLQVPDDDDYTQYKLMHPNVFIGWLPPPNALEDAQFEVEGVKSAIPCMVIGVDDGEDDGEDAGINVRITFITHNPGLYVPSEGDPDTNKFLPNHQGYKDLLNLIFICRQQLATSYLVAGGKTAASKPFRWGMYPNQPTPYWAGWLTFRASLVTLPYMGDDAVERLLNP